MNKKLKLWELNRKTEDEFREQEKFPIIVVLDDIRSLNNIGSFFRTADAFNIEKIILCGITATPPHRDIHKTALGATENVHWEYAESALDVVRKLQIEGTSVWAIEQTEAATPLDQFQPNPNQAHAFVLGNEVHGVAQEVVTTCGQALEIPQFGTKHSLNISVF